SLAWLVARSGRFQLSAVERLRRPCDLAALGRRRARQHLANLCAHPGRRGVVLRNENVRWISHARRRPRAGGGTLRRIQRVAQRVVLDAVGRRRGGTRRHLRSRGPHRAATDGDFSRLRIRGDHRRVRRPAASDRRRARRLAHVVALHRRRDGPARAAVAAGGRGPFSRRPAVLPPGGGSRRHFPRALRCGGRMTTEHWMAMLVGTVVAATPLVYAALGELIVERAGVLNLGVEGMMLVGALAAFATTLASGSLL